jgi:hypothetical protein
MTTDSLIRCYRCQKEKPPLSFRPYDLKVPWHMCRSCRKETGRKGAARGKGVSWRETNHAYFARLRN